MWRMIVVLIVALAGFWWGKNPSIKHSAAPLFNVHPEKEYPLSEHKSFVIVVHAYNQAVWCERALKSIFEQDYDHYRVVFIDDGSIDATAAIANRFIVDNNQEEKVIFIRNEARQGPLACLYRAVDSCLDREIVVPLEAKDWLSSPLSLKRLNGAYQNPDVWIAFAQSLDYPSYEPRRGAQASFYSALFKQIRLEDLFHKGQFATACETYIRPLIALAGGRVRQLDDPIAFFNLSSPAKPQEQGEALGFYTPLAQFPTPRAPSNADILIFSSDRPLQLYACLESIQRYISGFDNFTVLYSASHESFEEAYKKVKQAFPAIQFVSFKSDFKNQLVKVIAATSSKYLLLGNEDAMIKDFVDLKFCTDQLEKTGAYGFYLGLGSHIRHSYPQDPLPALPSSQSLSNGVFAWNFQEEGGFNSIDMGLFERESLKQICSSLKYQSIHTLESEWLAHLFPERGVGLYFEHSKAVSVPLNHLGSGASCLDTEGLLVKFNQGLKIDIEPLYKVENSSFHLDYIPEFVLR